MILGTATRPSSPLQPHEILLAATVIRAILDIKNPEFSEDAVLFLDNVVPSWRNRTVRPKTSKLFERFTPRQKKRRKGLAKTGR